MSREYSTAGGAVDAHLIGVSLKSYCCKLGKGKMGKVDFLLASETIKYLPVLQDIFSQCSISSETLDVKSNGMLFVLAYELLFGKQAIKGGGGVKRRLLEKLDDMRVVLQQKLKAKGTLDVRALLSDKVLLAEKLLTYLRVNQLLVQATAGMSTSSVLQEVRMQCPEAILDADIPHLIALPPKSKSFGEHRLVREGFVIIQDKASCFPSQILVDERQGGDTFDACAAPGNKTSHVASLLSERAASTTTCKVFAFEKNPRRAELLRERMQKAGADKIVFVQHCDYLQLDVCDNKYSRVRSVLLDPSCSGSGVLRDLNRLDDENEDEEALKSRLTALRDFQIQALRHSMRLPSVDLIVYSTCSIYEEENESVVAEILREHRDQWELFAPRRFANWKRRGLKFEGITQAESDCLLRCHPNDGLNGFFVSCFRKRKVVVEEEEEKEEEEEEKADIIEVLVEEENDGEAKRPKKKRRRKELWAPWHKKLPAKLWG